MELPAQLVDQPDPRVHQPFAVQRQLTDLELWAGEPGGRQSIDSFSQGGACDRERVHWVRLAAVTNIVAYFGHQLRR
jgi:hypothetical protein